MYTRMITSQGVDHSIQVGDIVNGGYNVLSMNQATQAASLLAKTGSALKPSIPGRMRLHPTTHLVEGVGLTELEIMLKVNGLPLMRHMNRVDNVTLESFIFQSSLMMGMACLPLNSLLTYMSKLAGKELYIHQGVVLQGYLGRVLVITDREKDDFVIEASNTKKFAYTLRSENKLVSGNHRKVKGDVCLIVPQTFYTNGFIPTDVMMAPAFNPVNVPWTQEIWANMVSEYKGSREDLSPGKGYFGLYHEARTPHGIVSLITEEIKKPCIAVMKILHDKQEMDMHVLELGVNTIMESHVKSGYINSSAVARLERRDAYDVEEVLRVILAARGIAEIG